MNFGKFSSVLFTLVQDDCHQSRSRQGDVGGGGVAEGKVWRGEYLSRQYVMMKRLENLLLDAIRYPSFDKV